MAQKSLTGDIVASLVAKIGNTKSKMMVTVLQQSLQVRGYNDYLISKLCKYSL